MAIKAAVGAAVLGAGFVALSDDDFSRTVIAERFAQVPELDPSGTSWLPLPFWIAGSAMAVFGRTLSVARAVAVALGIASALLVHRAAIWMRVPPAGALLAAAVAALLPTSARLGVSFQPEALSAGLVMLGAAGTVTRGPRRLGAAIALAAACLCRYEAWAAAAAFSAFSARDAFLAGEPGVRRRAAVAAVLAVTAPLLWMFHGRAAHGDALFFLHRVAAYRRALGVTEPILASLAAYPVALVATEPELVLGGAAALLATRGASAGSASAGRRARPAVVVGAVLAFLIAGRLLDGAPTHHAGRTLLPAFYLLAVLAADAVAGAVPDLGVARHRMAVTALAASLGLGIRLARTPEAAVSRSAELVIGEAARLHVPAGGRLLVDTPDYGYFAVIAAFGDPRRAEPFDRRDPREAAISDAFASAESLRARLAAYGAGWLVAHRRHRARAAAMGVVLTETSEFSLVRALR